MDNAACIEFLTECITMKLIPLVPVIQMTSGSKEISFTPVASRMCQNKIMAEIKRIARPRNKMVYVTELTHLPQLRLNFDKKGACSSSKFTPVLSL